jgi:hypothetical protein
MQILIWAVRTSIYGQETIAFLRRALRWRNSMSWWIPAGVMNTGCDEPNPQIQAWYHIAGINANHADRGSPREVLSEGQAAVGSFTA